ncbi:hypothetical protein BKA80DRAFT_100478 [Phyllosticta citrichinensis]
MDYHVEAPTHRSKVFPPVFILSPTVCQETSTSSRLHMDDTSKHSTARPTGEVISNLLPRHDHSHATWLTLYFTQYYSSLSRGSCCNSNSMLTITTTSRTSSAGRNVALCSGLEMLLLRNSLHRHYCSIALQPFSSSKAFNRPGLLTWGILSWQDLHGNCERTACRAQIVHALSFFEPARSQQYDASRSD